MKKIGFVDFYISEWHANNYPAWIARANELLGDDFEVAYAWAETDVSPVDGVTTKEWCEKFGVTPCETIAELCEKSDYILVLSPSNPEKHLAYAKAVFPYGKPTYIDKTFAPDGKTAQEIFDLAKKYGVPFFSTSALRYATELDVYADQARAVAITGGGGTIDEYLVHQTEMAVKCLGLGAKFVSYEKHAQLETVRVTYEDGRFATMTFAPALPFTVTASTSEKTDYLPVQSDYFQALLTDILRFYTSGTPSFDVAQTLEVMQIREAALLARESGETIELRSSGKI